MTMPEATKNSHYIARHLTRPWEFSERGRDRHLWYFDFDADSFGSMSSRSLHTTTAPWSQALELFLNKHLESPLSNFLSRFNADRTTEPSEIELRAMKLSVLLQAKRSKGTAEELVGLGERYLDELLVAADHVNEFVRVPLRAERLFFPDHGVIIIPLAAASPAVAVALHPSYLVAAVPRPAGLFLRQIDALRQDEENITSLSGGFEKCRRLVIPGSSRGRNSEAAMRSYILGHRRRAVLIARVFAEQNTAAFGSAFPGVRAR